MQSAAGDSLYVCDPGCSILRGVGLEGAARQFKVAGTDLAAQFPDQFSCWDFAGHTDFSQEVGATLIRLQLRTPTQAEDNSLCQVRHLNLVNHRPATVAAGALAEKRFLQACRIMRRLCVDVQVAHEPGAIKELLEAQLQPLGRSLLFLSNLRHVTVSHIAPDSVKPNTLGQVCADPDSTARCKASTVVRAGITPGTMQENHFTDVLRVSCLQTSFCVQRTALSRMQHCWVAKRLRG